MTSAGRRRILIGFGAALLVILSAPLALLASLDIDDYRGALAREVERRTGRQVTVAGELDLAVSLTPVFSVSNVRIANPGWASRPDMVRLDRIEARVALLPLLRGVVEIRRFVLSGARIELETDAGGRQSWVFDRPGEPAAAAELDLRVGEVRVRDLRVTFRDAAADTERSVELASAALARDGTDRLRLEVEGSLPDGSVSAEGRIGRLAALLTDAPYPVDLRASFAGVEIAVAGFVREPRSAPAFSGSVSIAASSAASGPLARLGLPAALALGAEAAVDARSGAVTLRDLTATVGDSRLAGSIDFAFDSTPPAVEADLRFSALDLDALLAGGGGAAESEVGRIFPARPVDLGLLGALDLDATIGISELRVAGVMVERVSARVALHEWHLAVDPLEVGDGGDRARATLHVDAAPERADVVLEVEAAQVDVGRLSPNAREARYVEGLADLSLDVNGHGRSVAELMATLDGEARLLMRDGQIRARSAELLIGGVNALMSASKHADSEWTPLGCAAVDLVITQGVARPRVLVVDTEHATVVGEGSVDLGREQFHLKLTPSPKRATINLAVPIKVGGTFVAPTFRPDELATARRVGSAALMVFPPAALASLGSLAIYGAGAIGAGGAVGEEHPCLALAEGDAGATTSGQSPPASKSKEMADTVKKGIGRAARRIKGLFGD